MMMEVDVVTDDCTVMKTKMVEMKAAKQLCRRKIPATINYRRGLDTTPFEVRFAIAATCPIALLIFVKECSPSPVAGDYHQNAIVALIPLDAV
ncbi:hypothetical protein LWI28_019235 [Acer negundo]|uniref:Uncharacterized protein n=1 Tax=Acer negundo TaxID=4023 RepID=A0AAD5I7K2_ACENE|nr:hypothetical protein LWI28_019235 [Acer negundo]